MCTHLPFSRAYIHDLWSIDLFCFICGNFHFLLVSGVLAFSVTQNYLVFSNVAWCAWTGHAMWPAVVVDESNVPATRALKSIRLDQSMLVQFFGTHDFARLVLYIQFWHHLTSFSWNYPLWIILRIKLKQAVPFLNGLVSSLHLKCKQASFSRSLEEAKEYVSLIDLQKEIIFQVFLGAEHIDGSRRCSFILSDTFLLWPFNFFVL